MLSTHTKQSFSCSLTSLNLRFTLTDHTGLASDCPDTYGQISFPAHFISSSHAHSPKFICDHSYFRRAPCVTPELPVCTERERETERQIEREKERLRERELIVL